MTTAEYAERVALGAVWLDERYPGWEALVDTERLRMHDPCRCIAGQLEGDYNIFRDEHDLDSTRVAELGLTLLAPYDFVDWYDLRQAWLALLETRAHAGEAS